MLETVGQSFGASRWAIIKDARRRQRRRQRRTLAFAALVALAAAAGWAASRDSLSANAPVRPPVAVGPITQVDLDGIVQSTATLHGQLWVLTCTHACSHPASPTVRGRLIELSGSGRPIKRYPVADHGEIAAGDGAIWLAHFYSGEVTRIDPQTGHATASTGLKLPKPIDAAGDRQFLPSAISFSNGRVWVSTARGWTAEINPRTGRVVRMAYSSSEATSATTAAGLTWVADELDGVGTFTPASANVVHHKISWAGQPLSIETVAQGAGLIWALGRGWEPRLTPGNQTVTVLTTINPRTERIIHQWRIPTAATMVLAGGGAYVGDSSDGRLLHLTPPGHTQILDGPRAASLTAASPHALWAITHAGQLLRISLERP